jgi:3-oxoacyl-[acyl-carrier-protein] synthase II
MAETLSDAALNPEDIQYINTHGTSTPLGDGSEITAIKTAFRGETDHLWVSSTKGVTGHTLGAAGALESVFCVQSLRDQVVPPTANLENPSDDCDLDCVPIQARDRSIENIMNNSFGFGGTNCSLIFSKLKETTD